MNLARFAFLCELSSIMNKVIVYLHDNSVIGNDKEENNTE